MYTIHKLHIYIVFKAHSYIEIDIIFIELLHVYKYKA